MMAYRLASSTLTSAVGYGFLNSPNYARRSNRLSCLPKTGRSIAAYSAVEVATVFRWSAFTYWQGVTSGIREDRRLRIGRGALLLPFLLPKLCEASMFRIYTTSRFLRLRHRLLSHFFNLAGHTAATVALGALLLLPALYFGEVL